MEAALDAEGLEGGDVGLGGLQRVPVELERQVVAQGHQLPGPPGRLGVLAQALLLLGALDLVDIRQQVVERAELLEERGGEPFADPGDPGDVVDRVAGQRQEVDDLVGPDAPFLLEGRRVDDRVLAEVEDPDVVGEELAGVLVGGADRRRPARVPRRGGRGWR